MSESPIESDPAPESFPTEEPEILPSSTPGGGSTEVPVTNPETQGDSAID